MNEKKYIELGFCKSAHGIKGGFSFFLHNPDESILRRNFEILIVPLEAKSSLPKAGKKMTIRDISFGNKVIVYLEGIEDRNQVESLIPFSIQILREELPETNDGYYLVDLIGLLVINHITKENLGVIDSFYENGPQLIAVVRGEQSFELPFIDQFFPIVDLENKKIEMIVPEYINE